MRCSTYFFIALGWLMLTAAELHGQNGSAPPVSEQGGGSGVDGNLAVSNLSAAPRYVYPISHFTAGGHDITTTLNFIGQAGYTAFYEYLPNDSSNSNCPTCDGWRSSTHLFPVWTFGVNGFAVTAFDIPWGSFLSDRLPGNTDQTLNVWMLDGYYHCNRLNDLKDDEDRDIIKILRVDGGLLELRNPVRRKDVAQDYDDSLYTGTYYAHGTNTSAYAIVQFDTTANPWPDCIAERAPGFPERNAWLPRTVYYYDGSGLEYVFREDITPSDFDTHEELSASAMVAPTVFYLREIRNENRTILELEYNDDWWFKEQPGTFVRSRRTISSFMGHKFTYGYENIVVEALDRSLTIDFGSEGSLLGWLEYDAGYADDPTFYRSICDVAGVQARETANPVWQVDAHRDDVFAKALMPRAIIDPVNRRTSFDYDYHSPRKTSGFYYEVQTAYARLTQITMPDSSFLTLEYDGPYDQNNQPTIYPATIKNADLYLQPGWHDPVRVLRMFERDSSLLTTTRYEIQNDTSNKLRYSTVRWRDAISGDSSRTELDYRIHSVEPALAGNQQDAYARPHRYFAAERVYSYSYNHKELTEPARFLSSAVYSNIDAFTGDTTAHFRPVEQYGAIIRGSGGSLDTLRLTHSTQTAHLATVPDPLVAEMPQAVQQRYFRLPGQHIQTVLDPTGSGDTLERSLRSYRYFPRTERSVNRLDSSYRHERSQALTDSLRNSGSYTTAAVYDTESYSGTVIMPPKWGLPVGRYAWGRNGAFLGGDSTVYYGVSDWPANRRGAPKTTAALAADGSTLLWGDTLSGTGGYYRKLFRESRDPFGARRKAFYTFADMSELGGSVPVAKVKHNNDAVSERNLYRVNPLYEAPAGMHTYLRYHDPVGGATATDTLAHYVESGYFALPIGLKDANGWFWEAEFDRNGRPLTAWHPYDFPVDCRQYLITRRPVRLFDVVTYRELRVDTLFLPTGDIRSGWIENDTLAGAIDLLNTSFTELLGSGGGNDTLLTYAWDSHAELVYTAGAADLLHGGASLADLGLWLHLSGVTPDACVTLDASCSSPSRASQIVLDCPSTIGIGGGAPQGAPQAVRFDMSTIQNDLQALNPGQSLAFRLDIQSAGRVRGLLHDDDKMPILADSATVLPALNDSELPQDCFHRDFTEAIVYNDAGHSVRAYHKIDDSLHTATRGWSKSWSGHDGRYTAGTRFMGAGGRVLKATEHIGHPGSPAALDSAVFAYYGGHRLKSATDPLGRTRYAFYNSFGDAIIVDDSPDLTNDFALRELLVSTPAQAATTMGLPADYFDGDPFYGVALLHQGFDEENRSVASLSNALGQVLYIQAPDGALTRLKYDNRGNLIERISPAGDSIRYTYDDFNRLQAVEQPDLGMESYAYDSRGQLRFKQTAQDHAEGIVQFVEYDDLGRPVVRGAARLGYSETRWTGQLDPDILHTATVQSPLPTVNPSLWLNPAAMPAIGSAPDSVRCSLNDAVYGRRPDLVEQDTLLYLRRTAPDYAPESPAQAAQNAFEDFQSYPGHALTVLQYERMPPARQGCAWQHFPADSLWHAMAPHGAVRNLKGRMAVQAYRDHGAEPFHYKVYSYDERGRVEAELRYTDNLGFDAVYYRYNSANQVHTVRVADPLRQHATWYSHDNNARVDSLYSALSGAGQGLGIGAPAMPAAMVQPPQALGAYNYGRGAVLEHSLYLPENISTQFVLHQRGWPDSLRVEQNGQNLFRQNFDFDSAGVIQSQHFAHNAAALQSHDYSYDNLLQLTAWNDSTQNRSWSYDRAGNRDTLVIDGQSWIYEYNRALTGGPNRLLRVSGPGYEQSFSYDAGGAATAWRTIHNADTLDEYTHYAGSLPIRYRRERARDTLPGGSIVEDAVEEWAYRHGPGGRQQVQLIRSPRLDSLGHAAGRMYYLRGGGNPLAVYSGRLIKGAETDCGSDPNTLLLAPREYLSYAPDGNIIVTRPDGSREYLINDNAGSVRAVAGARSMNADYYPYGAAMNSLPPANRAAYIGQEQDPESGHYHFNARQYPAEHGRFLRPDLLWGLTPDLNPYHYAANNPVMSKDPSGLFGQIAYGGGESNPLEPGEKEEEETESDDAPGGVSSSGGGFWLGYLGGDASRGPTAMPPGWQTGSSGTGVGSLGGISARTGFSLPVNTGALNTSTGFGTSVPIAEQEYPGPDNGLAKQDQGGAGDPTYSYNGQSGLSSLELYFHILIHQAAEEFGITDIVGLSLVFLGSPILGTRAKLGENPIRGTSVASKYLPKILPGEFAQPKPTWVDFPKILGGKGMKKRYTTLIARFAARWVPFLGWAILIFEIATIFYKTQVEYNRITGGR